MAALGGLAAAGAAAGILFAASPWSDEPEPAATEESAAETPSTTLRRAEVAKWLESTKGQTLKVRDKLVIT